MVYNFPWGENIKWTNYYYYYCYYDYRHNANGFPLVENKLALKPLPMYKNLVKSSVLNTNQAIPFHSIGM